jgi:serine/threonine protein kinase
MPLGSQDKGRNVVNGRWRLDKRIGFGSFGDIYVAADKQNGKTYAAKIEKANTKYPQLKFENKVYRAMYTYNGFPRAHWMGDSLLTLNSKTEKHNVLIMDRLGDSLESLYTSCDRKFGVKTVCMIGIQIVNRIQSLHSEGYLHRDIKPDNFLIGSGDRSGKDGSVIHMIDMGLAKAFKTSNGGHIPMKEGKRLTGTPRYASINTHNGFEQSRRDDLESLCYILIYFLKGRLPWQGMQGSTKADKYDQIRKKKIEMTPEKLCKDLPEEFINFLNYVRKLEFTQEPDYKFLKKLLQLCCQRVESRKIDWRFAWQQKDKSRSTVWETSSSHQLQKRLDVYHNSPIKTPKKEDSVQCLSKPPNRGQQQALHNLSDRTKPLPKKRRREICNSPTTPSERNQRILEKIGGNMVKTDAGEIFIAAKAYQEMERERDKLKRKCYEYEVNQVSRNAKVSRNLKISWCKKANKHQALVWHNGKYHWAGYYDSVKEADKAMYNISKRLKVSHDRRPVHKNRKVSPVQKDLTRRPVHKTQKVSHVKQDLIQRLVDKTLNFDISELAQTLFAAALNQKLRKDLQKARQKSDRSYQHSRKRAGGRKRRAEEDAIFQKKPRFGDSLSPIQIE